MKNLLVLIIVVSGHLLYGQSGFNVYAGLTQATNRDALITPEGTSHPGFHIGCDARLNSGGMYFIVGGQYHKLDFLAQEANSFLTVEETMIWLKLRVGLGYTLFSINDKMSLRAKTLGSINVISTYPTALDSAPYAGTNYNTGTAGLLAGLGLDLYFLTIDVEYERGFFNAVNMIKGTEYDFLTLSVGFLF